MMMLKKQNVSRLLDELRREYEVFYPTRDEEGIVSFSNVGNVVLDYSNSTLPPKDLFLPQTETTFEFEKGAEFRLQPRVHILKRIVFGIRPCDVNSLILLDKVFSGDFLDPYYLQRRRNTSLIAINCTEPEKNCFCSFLETGPSLKEGADIVLTDLGDFYYVEALTEKGKKLVDSELSFFEEVNVEKEIARKRKVEITKTIDLKGIAERLEKSIESPYWGKVSKKCLNCAICTYLCPTCYCFDAVDESLDFKGQRIRCWDSCMFPSYSRMAGGINPRATKKDRLMQRVYHKFKYFDDRYGNFACVGCGRCVTACPVNIDITKIVSEVRGE